VFAFERIEPPYPYLPLSARRVLDAIGKKLSLDGWLSLSEEDRATLIRIGAAAEVDAKAASPLLARARPPASDVPSVSEPDPSKPPVALLQALGPQRPIPHARWSALRPLERYALVKSMSKPEKLSTAYEAIVGSAPAPLTHLNAAGEANMVDVGAKPATARRAVASARLTMSPDVLARVAAGGIGKGDVFAVARVAGIQAAKKTPELIPLCHSVALTRVEVTFETRPSEGEVWVRATAEAFDRTGVEMEALVAASTAALTVYDMVKAADRWMTIQDVRLEEKGGGRSGLLRRPE
jgi:cyclic pyranopterin phosphate synthase